MFLKNSKKSIFLFALISLAGCGQSSGNAPDILGVINSTNNGSCSSGGKCKIYVSNQSYATGAIGLPSTLDITCNSDSNKPAGGGTYKALVMTATRSPPSTNWVLYPNRTYTRSDGTTVIGVTNGNSIFFGDTTLDNPIVPVNDDRVWATGIIVDHDGTWVTATGYNCTNFQTASSTDLFTYGKTGTGKVAFGFYFGPIQYGKCDGSENSSISSTNPHILCVEQ